MTQRLEEAERRRRERERERREQYSHGPPRAMGTRDGGFLLVVWRDSRGWGEDAEGCARALPFVIK